MALYILVEFVPVTVFYFFDSHISNQHDLMGAMYCDCSHSTIIIIVISYLDTLIVSVPTSIDAARVF